MRNQPDLPSSGPAGGRPIPAGAAGEAGAAGPSTDPGAPPAPGPGPAHGTDPQPERPMGPALRRGWRRRCPNCGQGPLMKGYLTVNEHCPVCREPYHHHRADDGPAYLTILIVGHLSAPLLGSVWMAWQPEPLVLFTIFAIGTVALSLYLLPRLKGAMVAFQWARYMHGFGGGD